MKLTYIWDKSHCAWTWLQWNVSWHVAVCPGMFTAHLLLHVFMVSI